jgi:hypothetical protein
MNLASGVLMRHMWNKNKELKQAAKKIIHITKTFELNYKIQFIGHLSKRRKKN